MKEIYIFIILTLTVGVSVLYEEIVVMKDMISQIVEMDKRARKATDEVQNHKVNMGHEIQKLCKEMREEYFERAYNRVRLNEKIESRSLDTKLSNIEKKYKDAFEKLNNIYKSKEKEWEEEIFNRVLGM